MRGGSVVHRKTKHPATPMVAPMRESGSLENMGIATEHIPRLSLRAGSSHL